jgi:hypothetical protein
VLLGRKADLEAQLVEREFPDLNGLDYLIQMSVHYEKRDARRRCGQGRRTGGIGEHHRCGMWMRELDELRTELLKDAV